MVDDTILAIIVRLQVLFTILNSLLDKLVGADTPASHTIVKLHNLKLHPKIDVRITYGIRFEPHELINRGKYVTGFVVYHHNIMNITQHIGIILHLVTRPGFSLDP